MDVFFNKYNQDDFLLISRKYFPDKEVLYPGKEFACNAGDPGLIPGMGRSSGGGHGNPLQYSCSENPMDRGAWSLWLL